jgi:hypothetical protein
MVIYKAISDLLNPSPKPCHQTRISSIYPLPTLTLENKAAKSLLKSLEGRWETPRVFINAWMER